MAWRKNNRRVSNGEQYFMTTSAALIHPVFRQWKVYWRSAVLVASLLIFTALGAGARFRFLGSRGGIVGGKPIR
jgi:hypothetical protein